jgi:hypothetical protein
MNRNSGLSRLDEFLSCLENVKPSGKGYTACCPAHDSKSRSSLSVGVGDDGRVLLHCHGQCGPLEVVHAVGKELGDLFERTVETHRTPRPTWQQRALMKMRQWKACRSDFLSEVSVLLSVAGQAYHGYPVSEEDKERTERAARIIRKTLEYL